MQGFFRDCQALRRLCSIKRSTSPVESVTYNFVLYKKLPSCMPTCHPFICKQRLYALFIATGILLREMSCGIVPLKTRVFPASKSLPLLQVKEMMYSKAATNWNAEWLSSLLTGKLQLQNNQVRFLSQCYGYNTFYNTWLPGLSSIHIYQAKCLYLQGPWKYVKQLHTSVIFVGFFYIWDC